MRFVTSFAPSRIERQQHCLQSWAAIASEVIGIQSPGEAEQMRNLFPGVQFVETELVGDMFGRPKNVRVRPLVEQAKDKPVLLINSDIEIVQEPAAFIAQWSTSATHDLKAGIRWERHPATGAERLLKYGIDVFLVTPDMVDLLPDIGLTIGCPGWDYWLPWMLHRNGYRIDAEMSRVFLHETHGRTWRDAEHDMFCAMMASRYKIARKQLTLFIQQQTHRKHLPHWVPVL